MVKLLRSFLLMLGSTIVIGALPLAITSCKPSSDYQIDYALIGSTTLNQQNVSVTINAFLYNNNQSDNYARIVWSYGNLPTYIRVDESKRNEITFILTPSVATVSKTIVVQGQYQDIKKTQNIYVEKFTPPMYTYQLTLDKPAETISKTNKKVVVKASLYNVPDDNVTWNLTNLPVGFIDTSIDTKKTPATTGFDIVSELTISLKENESTRAGTYAITANYPDANSASFVLTTENSDAIIWQNNWIPQANLNIDGAGKLIGFKNNPDLSLYDTLRFPSYVVSVGNDAFDGALPDSIKHLDFGSALVTSIGDCAFRHNHISTDLVFPNTLKSIGNDAFYLSEYGTTVSPPTIDLSHCGSLKTINGSAFYGQLFSKSLLLNDNIERIEGSNWTGAFMYLGAESGFNGSLRLPNKIKHIGPNAFLNLGYARSATSQPTFTIAFDNCTQLTEIQAGAFGDAKWSNPNKALVFPNSLQKIGNNAFSGGGRNGGLASVTFGPNIVQIGELSFEGASDLNTIRIEANRVISNYGNDSHAGSRDFLRRTKFRGQYYDGTPDPSCKIYVPTNLLNAYKTSPLWKSYYNDNNLFEAIP